MGKVIKSRWHNPVKYILPVVILSLSMFCIDAFALELHSEDHISIKRIKLSKGNESLWSNWSIGAIIKALLIDGDYLWIGTSDGVIRYNKKNEGQVVYTIKDGLRSQSILSIARDREGIKWFGTNGGGLTSYDGKRWKTYDSKDGLVDEYVWSIAFEPDGTMWVGTWYGVNKIKRPDEKPWGRYTLEVLANEWVYVTMIDKEGTKWFGT
ncbi:MAG: two-component regulator propeller domain-containing protein, partial [Nitrospirota bacterium]